MKVIKYNKIVLVVIFIIILLSIICISLLGIGTDIATAKLSEENEIEECSSNFIDSVISVSEDIYFKNEFIAFLSNMESINIDSVSIQNIPLFDLRGEPNFVLTYAFDKGYMISNRITATSYEKSGNTKSPYDTSSKKKNIYLGFGNYFTAYNGLYYNNFNGCSVDLAICDMLQKELDKIMAMDLKECGVKNYLARTSNEDRLNNSTYFSTEGEKYFNKQWTTYGYYKMGTGKYDLLFPENNGTSCGIVASIQLLQYLDRQGIVDTTSAFRNAKTDAINYTDTTNFKKFSEKCLTQVMHNELDSLIWSGAFGENYCNDLINGMNKFFEKYQPTMKVWVSPTPPMTSGYYHTANAVFNFHPNSFYDNMVGQIQSGKPAIGLTSMGNGYYQSNGSWTSNSVARHIMLVYGYCTTDKDTLKDFVTHSGWRNNGTEKMYVYKLNFLGNITYDLSFEPFIIL